RRICSSPSGACKSAVRHRSPAPRGITRSPNSTPTPGIASHSIDCPRQNLMSCIEWRFSWLGCLQNGEKVNPCLSDRAAMVNGLLRKWAQEAASNMSNMMKLPITLPRSLSVVNYQLVVERMDARVYVSVLPLSTDD